MSKNVLFIVGSLRKGSFNGQLAKMAEKALGEEVTVSYLDWSRVPIMNQDIEVPVPEAVEAVRKEVMSADAVWIFSPVYNAAIPGSVKNLLDWLSRSLDLSDSRGESAIHQKTVLVSSVAGGNFSSVMMTQYEALLPFIRTNLLSTFAGSINPEAWGNGELVLPQEKLEELHQQAAQLIAELKK